jgi:hypothetical protein
MVLGVRDKLGNMEVNETLDSVSFIRINRQGIVLMIDTVQKAASWTLSGSFCSLLLPAIRIIINYSDNTTRRVSKSYY